MKNSLAITLVFILSLLLVEECKSEIPDVCVNNLINYNICDSAKEIQNEFAPQLPQQLSENLFLRSVASVDNKVILNALLLYERSYLEQELLSYGRSMDSIEKQMKNMTENMMCTMQLTSDFIYLGGSVIFNYHFNNGEHYLTIEIDNCDGY
ncbi:MAG: hypothetical protein P8K09_01765 [Hyphomicrobiales bacterium]|jgi:hypothetical protein|nr:hypothetical protein [Hyphomicrobiales bacterium]